jgi:hypothetical protein
VVIGGVGGDAIGLAVHGSLAVRTESSLTISRVVLMIVGVAVVRMVVSRILAM